MPSAQRAFPSGFAGSLACDDLGRAQAFHIVGLLRPPARSRDLKATVGKNCNRDQADAASRLRRQAGASRATGRSTIGKLIAADRRPSRIESHQTAS